MQMICWCLCLFVSAADVQTSDEHNCTYLDVLQHLNLTKNKEKFTMIRPVKNYKEPVTVTLDVLLYAMLDVVSGCLYNFIIGYIGLISLLSSDITGCQIHVVLALKSGHETFYVRCQLPSSDCTQPLIFPETRFCHDYERRT